MKAICLLLLLALAGFAGGADADGKRERERTAPANRCAVHDEPLVKVTGFTVERGKPTMDYIQFSSETRRQFPHTTPIGFSSTRDDMHPREITFTKCERCNAEFQRAFAEYKRLSEAEKSARYGKYLRNESRKSR